LTWWGSLSYRSLPREELRAAYPEAWDDLYALPVVRCPRCGSRSTFEILDDGSVDPSGALRSCRGGHRTRGDAIDENAARAR
jgi:hypothetical protein